MGYREGDGAAAAGGEHRDAGPPPAAMGREAGHQEGGKGKAGPRVPAEHILVGHPRAARPGGAGEDRPDRVEPEALQGLRLGRIVFTPSAVPTRARSAIPRNRPCSTTTGIEEIAAASFAGERIPLNRGSRRDLPLAVRTGSASLFPRNRPCSTTTGIEEIAAGLRPRERSSLIGGAGR